jgi:hypothetical protein
LTGTDATSNATTTLQPLNPGGAISAPPALDLDRLDYSLLFELPPEYLHGLVKLTATATAPAGSAPPIDKWAAFVPQPVRRCCRSCCTTPFCP